MNFRNAKGHTIVTKEEDSGLHQWINDQRQLAKKRKMSSDRKQKLEDIGFIFELIECDKTGKFTDHQIELWETRYSQLVNYHKIHGHTRVTYGENPSLGSWVGRQRAAFRNGAIDGDRMDRLNQLGFQWNVRGKPGVIKDTSTMSVTTTK